MKFCLLVFLSMFLVVTGTLATPLAMGKNNEGHLIVWSQSDPGLYSLQMSRKQNNRWSAPEIIEESDRSIPLPVFSEKKNDFIFVVWTELNGDKGRIRCKIKRDGAWGSVQEMMTVTSCDMAPVSIIDSSGVPWIVWSGTDETDDDIYFSRWMDNQWQQPERVNEDDGWPDFIPQGSQGSFRSVDSDQVRRFVRPAPLAEKSTGD
jgi:hypothetical protein